MAARKASSPKTPTPNGVVRDRVVRAAANGQDQVIDTGALAAIIQPTVKDRWLSLMRRDYKASDVRVILDSTNYGSPLYMQQQMFELMEESWPRLGKNLFEIRSAVSRANWIIQPYTPKGSKPTDSAQEKADFVEDVLFNMTGDIAKGTSGFVDMIFDLCDAYGKGIVVSEIDWQRRADGVLAPIGTRWLKSVYYDYPVQPDMPEHLMLSPSGKPQTDLIDFPDNKFLIGTYRFRSSNLAGRFGLMRSLAPWWIFTNFATEWVLQYGQLFGLPIRWANYTNASDLKTVSQMLENMGAVGWGAFPQGTTLNLHETTKGASENPNAFLLNYSDSLCDIVTQGQTLTTNTSNNGNRSLGEVHERVLTGRQKHLAIWAGEMITRQLVRSIILLNYGNTDEVPTLQPVIDDPTDPQAQAVRDKTLFVDMKLPVSLDYLYEEHGIPRPAETDDLYIPPTPPPSPFGGSPTDTGDEPSADENENENENPSDVAARTHALDFIRQIPDVGEHTINAVEKLPTRLVVYYAKELGKNANLNYPVAPGTPSARVLTRFKRGQRNGGRFMSKQNSAAIDRVKKIMATWPSEGQHRARRHIAAFGLPDNEAEFRSYLTPDMADEVDNRARALKKTATVNLADLKTTQSNIDGEKVMAMLMTGDDSTQLLNQSPVVIKRSNKLWLWDGHHRAAKAKMKNDATIKARIVDVEDLKK